MTEHKTVTYKCVGCGRIKETDTGFAATVVPAPEVSLDHLSLEQAQVLPLNVEVEKEPAEPCIDCEEQQESKSLEEGLYYNIGDCPECGSHHWARTGGIIPPLPPLEAASPADKQENQEDCPECTGDKAETGFSTAVAPTPEVSNEALAQQFATSSLSDADPAPKKKVECAQCGRVEEIDENVNEIPGCITCGSADWGQVPR